MSTDHQASGDYGDQLSLLPDMPAGGEQYRNKWTDEICTVVSVNCRHRPQITYRHWGHERVTDLQMFQQNWVPYRLTEPAG